MALLGQVGHQKHGTQHLLTPTLAPSPAESQRRLWGRADGRPSGNLADVPLGSESTCEPVIESGSEKTSGLAEHLMSYGTLSRAHPHFETRFPYLSIGENLRTHSALASPDAMIGVVSAVLPGHPAALLQWGGGRAIN